MQQAEDNAPERAQPPPPSIGHQHACNSATSLTAYRGMLLQFLSYTGEGCDARAAQFFEDGVRLVDVTELFWARNGILSCCASTRRRC